MPSCHLSGLAASVIAAGQSSFTAASTGAACGSYTVLVAARDGQGNPVGCTAPTAGSFGLLWDGAALAVGGPNTCTPGPDPVAPLFLATLRPARAGGHTLAPTYGGVALATGQPASVTLGPGPVDALASGLAVANRTEAGRPLAALVTARDACGNVVACPTGAAGLVLLWDGAATSPAASWACAGPAFRGSLTPTAAGLHALGVTLGAGGPLVGGEAARVTVCPGAIAAGSSAFAVSSRAVEAGDLLALTLAARDAYGNPVPCTGPTAALAFACCGTGSPSGPPMTGRGPGWPAGAARRASSRPPCDPPAPGRTPSPRAAGALPPRLLASAPSHAG
ncbi:hypothetical protein PAPYR_4583 [Paratrimastix pyriformis]|uniref:Uncharacterized protein n=1 Tax=Paratrimastix pyriformis TaxID=342808 RepID=A0ABQ8UJX7_9EUKA|nr:hypothetical protein PAPYR_4583 [Paratrimastix pyriformis]